MTAIVSGMFGSIAATRSPTPIPAARIACCRRETSARKLVPGEPPLDLVLAAEDDRGLGASRPKQVFGEIQPRVGEEARLAHRVAVAAIRRPPFSPMTPQKSQTRSQNAAGVADRPGVQRLVGGEDPGRRAGRPPP